MAKTTNEINGMQYINGDKVNKKNARRLGGVFVKKAEHGYVARFGNEVNPSHRAADKPSLAVSELFRDLRTSGITVSGGESGQQNCTLRNDELSFRDLG